MDSCELWPCDALGWLCWDIIPIHLPQKVIILAGSQGVISLGGVCGNQYLWMRRRGSNTTEPHRGSSCAARQSWGQNDEKQLHRQVEEKKLDHL